MSSPRLDLAPKTLSEKLAPFRNYPKLVLALVLLSLLITFAAQNAESTQVTFLAWNVRLSQALVIIVSLLVGLVVGVVLIHYRRRRSMRMS